jgi:hypothetical protein
MTLRPLQFGFKSEEFMLSIRLGMINARGPQDLVLYVLTRTGRVDTTNYRTVNLPANMDIPVYLRPEFTTFYKALFNEQGKRTGQRVVLTEYVWNMGWCDPCAADPLSQEALKAAGADDVNLSCGYRHADRVRAGSKARARGRAERGDHVLWISILLRADSLWVHPLFAAPLLWFGQPWALYLHQLTSGALVLFTFFMISDPMTTPNRAATRDAYAVIVAVGAFVWQFLLFKPHGLIWALFLATPIVPLFDRIWLGAKHEWRPGPRSASGRPA